MNIRLNLIALIVVLLTGSFDVTTLVAQPFDLSWHTIDAGGGYSAGAGFEVQGTIGQHDTGSSNSPAGFTMEGGFWAAEFSRLIIVGDLNGDGVVNLLDVAPFVDAVTSGTYTPEADINQDGVVDLLDVAAFVDLLTS